MTTGSDATGRFLRRTRDETDPDMVHLRVSDCRCLQHGRVRGQDADAHIAAGGNDAAEQHGAAADKHAGCEYPL